MRLEGDWCQRFEHLDQTTFCGENEELKEDEEWSDGDSWTLQRQTKEKLKGQQAFQIQACLSLLRLRLSKIWSGWSSNPYNLVAPISIKTRNDKCSRTPQTYRLRIWYPAGTSSFGDIRYNRHLSTIKMSNRGTLFLLHSWRYPVRYLRTSTPLDKCNVCSSILGFWIEMTLSQSQTSY